MRVGSLLPLDGIRRQTQRLILRSWYGSVWRRWVLFGTLFLSIFSLIASNFLIADNAQAAVANGGIYAYGDSADNGNMNFRAYTDPTTVGSELTTVATDTTNDIGNVRTAAAPTREEIIAVHMKNTGRLDVVTCTSNCDAAADWTLRGTYSTAVTDAGAETFRPFDVAYEQLSGNAVVFFTDDNTTGTIYYCEWNGSSWSPSTECNGGTFAPGAGNDILPSGVSVNGQVEWIRAEPRGDRLTTTRSDEMLLAASDSADDMWVAHWTGSAADQATNLTNGGSAPNQLATTNAQKFDIAWEETTGEGLAVLTDTADAQMRYSIYTSGGGWAAVSTDGPTNPTTTAWNGWLDLATDPMSDDIALIGLLSTPDADAAVWTGSSWTNSTTNITDQDAVAGKNMAVEFERFSGRAIYFNVGASDLNVDRHCWTSGGGFTALDTSFISTSMNSDDIEDMVVVGSPNNNRMLGSTHDIDDTLEGWTYSGATGCADSDFANTSTAQLHGAGIEGVVGSPNPRLAHGSAYKPYSPWTRNWEWFGDVSENDPDESADSQWGGGAVVENTEPSTDVDAEDFVRLRININETGNMAQTDTRKKLQFTSGCTPNSAGGEAGCTWTDVGDTGETSAVWRYATSGETCTSCSDNTAVGANRLTGTNQNGAYTSDKDAAGGTNMDHNALAIVEYDFPLKAEAVEGSTTYYFRLYEPRISSNGQDSAVFREQDDDGANDCASAACTYPSLTTAAPVLTVSGTCDQYDQSTDCSDDGANEIKVAYDGTAQSQVDTVVDGSWSITGLSVPASGTVITIYINGETTANERANAVTKYDGTGLTVTNVQLFQRHLSIGSDDNQIITNANLSQFDSSVSGDADIFFDVSAGNDLTVDSGAAYSDEELYIASGDTFQPASGGGADVSTHDIEIDGSFTADSNAITINGSWDNDGDYNAGTETITFTSTGSETIDSTGSTDSDINNVIFNGSGGQWTLTTALVVNADMTSTAGTVAGTQNLTVADDLICGASCGSISLTGGTTTLSGTTVDFGTTSLSSNWTFSSLTFNSSATVTANGNGTITVSSVMNIGGTLNAGAKTYALTGSGDPLVAGGTFTAQTSTVSYEGTSATNVPALTYNDIQFNPASGTPTYTIQKGVAAGSTTKIDDASNFGFLPNGDGRGIVEDSSENLYTFLSNSGDVCELWRSTDGGSSWSEQDSGDSPSCTNVNAHDLAIDSTDTIHLVYGVPDDLNYNTFNTGTSQYGTPAIAVDHASGFVVANPVIALDSNNVPHIAYIDNFAGEELYRYKNRVGGSWNTDVDISGSFSLAIDEDNIPILSYPGIGAYGNANNATSFASHTVDATVASGTGSSIAVDSSGNTWIAYTDENGASDFLTIAKRDDGSESSSWSTGWQTPTNNSQTGSDAQLAISGTDVFIVYVDGTSTGNIAFDKYNGSWSGETTIDTGTYSSPGVRWAFYNNSYPDNLVDLIFSDGTDVYWHALVLSAGSDTLTANNFTLVNASGTPTVNADTSDPTIDINGNFSINKGTFTASDTAALTVAGNVSFCTTCTFTHSSATLTLNGATSTTLNTGCSDTDACTATDLNNLVINKPDGDDANDNVTLTTNGIRVVSTLTITDGELIQGTLNARVEGSSAVSIASGAKWTNISTGDLKLGGTFVNAGTAVFNSNNGTQCVNAADDIVITSTSGGSQRAWSGGGTFTLRNLDVTDMTDSSITVYTSNLSNTTWTEGNCGTIVSGGCFTDETEGTPCGDAGPEAIKVAVNGTVDPASDGTVDGSWSLTVATLSVNDILVIFVDGEDTASEEATTVVKYDGTGNITLVKMYQSQLVIGTDSGSTNSDQTITAADLNTGGNGYENSDDEDVLYDYTAGADITVDAEANKTEQLYIMNGDTYRPASGGGSDTTTHNLEIDTGATITADSNAFTIGGSWNNGGTFTAGTGTVAFNTTVTGNTLSGTLVGDGGKFNDVTFTTSDATATDDWEIQAALTAGNDFTLSAGNIDSNNNNVTITRDFTITNASNTDYDAGSSTVTVSRHFTDSGVKFTAGTSTVIMDGTGTFTGTGASSLYSFSIAYSGFTTTISVGGSLVLVSNITTVNGGTVTGTNAGINVRCNTTCSGRFVFAAATSFTGSGDNRVNYSSGATDLTITLTGGNYGGWAVQNIPPFNNTTYEWGGGITTTSYYHLTASSGVTGTILNTNGETLSADRFEQGISARTGATTTNFGASDINLTSTSDGLYVGSNGGSQTMNLGSATFDIKGNIRFANGTGTVTASGTTSVIEMTPAASASRTFTTNGQTIDNFVVNGGNSAATIVLDGNLLASDNLTMTVGTLNVTTTPYHVTVGGNVTAGSGAWIIQMHSSTWTVSGNWDTSAVATDYTNVEEGTSTLLMNGTGTKTIKVGATNPFEIRFYNLTVGQSGNTTQLLAGIAYNGVLSLGTGTFDLNSFTVYAGNNDQADPLSLNASGTWGTGNGSLFFFGSINKNLPAFTYNSSVRTELNTGVAVIQQGTVTITENLEFGCCGRASEYDTNNQTLTVDGNVTWINNIGIFTAGSSIVSVGGNWDNTLAGVFNADSSTIRMTTATTATITPGGQSFFNLTIDGSGAVTPDAATTVTNDLTMTAGSLLGTQNITVNGHVAGTAGIINLTGGTFKHRPSTSKNFGTTSGSAAWIFTNLTFSNGTGGLGTTTITTQSGGSGSITVTGILAIGESGDIGATVLDAGNRTWILSGTGGDPFQILASPAGNLTPNTSTFTYTGNNGSGDTTVQSETYNVLQVNHGSEIFNLEGTTVASDVTVSAGTLALNSQILQATDDLTVDGTLSGTTNVIVGNDAIGTGIINLTGGTFSITGSSGGNFGTTSGSNSWIFNNVTFEENGDFSGMTVTTQTGSGTITVSGILTVGNGGDGTGTTLNAGNRTWTLSGTGGNPFQLVGTAPDLVPATSTFTYTGNNGSGDTTVQSETYNVLQVNHGSEIYNLEGTTVGLDVTVSAGTLALNSQTLQATNDLTVNGTLSGSTGVTVNGSAIGSGTITLSGGTFTQRITANANETFGSTSGSNNWTFSTLIFRNSDTNNHSITFNPTGSGQVIVSTALTIGSGTDGNTLTLDNDTNDRILDVGGSVTIATTAIFEPSGSASFTVADDWTNSGTFNHNNGTITFDTTTTATIAGTTTFYGFRSVTAAKTIQFTAGETFTIDTGGLLTLTGAADPNEIQIQSTTASQWFINHQGTESVSFAQVINSGCDVSSTDITTADSVDDGNNGDCWLFGSEYAQGSYRFGQPNGVDIDYTGAPAENAAYTTSGTGDDFRLRLLINVSGSNLAQNGNDFSLQFGEKTGATCDSGVSWADVETASGVIRYFDGGGRADGDNLTGNAGDPDDGNTVVDQDYEEANDFTNSVAAINNGEDGLWDFSLVNNSAVGGKRYCFKAVDVTGAADLTAYNQYPEVIVDEELIFTLDSTSKDWGIIQPGDNPTNQTSTLTTSTNSSTGYVIYAWTTQAMTLTNGFGTFTIDDWTGTNATPTTFGNGSFGFGYTTDDSSLTGGTADRFTNGGAKYAGFTHTGPGDPVADRTSGPVASQQDQITYRLAANTGQQAGEYETVVVYVVSVTF